VAATPLFEAGNKNGKNLKPGDPLKRRCQALHSMTSVPTIIRNPVLFHSCTTYKKNRALLRAWTKV